ncbi:MAG: glycosyltransferase [Parcubacteria group bacterium]|nr:glycosyltransferase [Parcubacteria group bacterium]
MNTENNNKTLVHIVIPLYNEEKIISKTVERLASFLIGSAFPYEYTITLVNNASTDNSLVLCENLAEKFSCVRVLNLVEKGKGRAVRTSWSSESIKEDDVVSFMDTDLSSDLTFFRSLVDAVVIEKYDLAIGNRLGKNSKVISRHRLRKLASHLYNIFIRMMFRTGIEDHQCGFKVMSKQAFSIVAPFLQDNAWFFDTELIVVALRKKLKIKSIDIIWTDSTDSKVSLGKTSYDMFRAAWGLKGRLKDQKLL